MSHMLCTCGHDIADNTDHLPYAGVAYVIRDQIEDRFWDVIAHEITSFAAALTENKRERWISERMGAQYPRDLADRDVLQDVLWGHFAQRSLAMYQCENCGRLWVQDEPYSNHYRPFHPEGEWRDTLAVRETVQSAYSDDDTIESAQHPSDQ